MKRKIKILVDAHLFDGMFQGSRTFLKGLYSTLSESDSLDIYLAAHNTENLEREFSDVNGSLKFIELKNESKIRRLLIDFPSIVNKYKFDYVHFQYIDSPIKLCKTIITIHDVLFLEFPEDFSWLYRQKRYLFQLAASRADILTTDSEHSRQSINHCMNVPLEDIHIVRPALGDEFLDMPSTTSFERSGDRVKDALKLDKYILYVSRIEPRKNHDTLLQAYLDLALWKRGYHLVFVGKSSIENPKLNALFESMDKGIHAFVHYYESIPQELLIDLIRAASLFVYPTRAEGFGYPPLEAGALGVETLTSNATCLSEFTFFHDRFFDPDDLTGLKSKMLDILSGCYSGTSMSDISETIRNHYTWSHSGALMERLIHSDFNAKK